MYSAENVIHLFGCLEESRSPKINDFKVELICLDQQNVLGLQVPMNNVVFVAVIHSKEDLLHDLSCEILVHSLLLLNPSE